ncbi:AraC-like DNA-binding protein [Marinobacterium sp. MBR-111]|jgi:AraC-like DNA-binding protein|uniref:AraC family transcriptional regulator n=1 Tax=Marinobacterium sp. MBR-111 TaxID=3156463 RepID=UPI00339413EA
MSIEHLSISTHYPRSAIASAALMGLDCSAILDEAGLCEDILNCRQLRVTPNQFARLMLAVMRDGDDEFLGLGSVPSRYGVFNLMAKQAVHCQNLKSVYQHIRQFYNLLTDAIDLSFRLNEGTAVFSMKLTEPDKDAYHLLSEFLMLIWHRFPSWLTGQRIKLKEIHFSYPQPEHSTEYRLLFPCTVRFNQSETGFFFDAELLNLPVVQTPKSIRAYLRRVPLEWFMRQAYFPAFTRKVLDQIENRTGSFDADMECIASALHVTPRTLRRKLTEEGTSFQELRDNLRRNTAIHYLSRPSLPISEIARKLGYSEPASFTRAFKQWTGVTPRMFRKS